jgi:hypothetical protein
LDVPNGIVEAGTNGDNLVDGEERKSKSDGTELHRLLISAAGIDVGEKSSRNLN